MFQETIPAELISLFFDKYKEVAQAGILEKTVPCPCKFPPCVWNQGELPQLKAPIPESELQTVAGVGVGVGVAEQEHKELVFWLQKFQAQELEATQTS